MARLPAEPAASEITSEPVYRSRRELLKNAALFGATATAVGAGLLRLSSRGPSSEPEAESVALAGGPPGAVGSGADGGRSPYSTDEAQTPYAAVTTYNNFYEFGLDKSDPAARAHTLKTRPWTLEVSGEVKRPFTLDLETLLNRVTLEDRIYRMRCVEAWSMVIPWLGFPLSELIARCEPTSQAKYVAFTTLLAPEQMPGQKSRVLEWPYVEGLRLDEATHPLAFMAVGLYGKPLPNQNGAPLRLVVPWKYGFKGIKSIVSLRFTREEPPTSWNRAAPREYGFYANVNPAVDHPRWSQATERRIGELRRRPTLPFNGYAEQVASLYRGMDLVKSY